MPTETLTPKQLTSARTDLGLSVRGLRDILQLKVNRTIQNWEAGSTNIPGPVCALMNALMTNRDVRAHFDLRLPGDPPLETSEEQMLRHLLLAKSGPPSQTTTSFRSEAEIEDEIARYEPHLKLLWVRKINDETQAKFAETMGVSLRTYSKFESGAGPIPIDKLLFLSTAYDFPASVLFSRRQMPFGDDRSEEQEEAIFRSGLHNIKHAAAVLQRKAQRFHPEAVNTAKKIEPHEKLRSTRVSQKRSKKHYAALVGVSPSTYGNYEIGKTAIPSDKLLRLAVLANFNPAAIVR